MSNAQDAIPEDSLKVRGGPSLAGDDAAIPTATAAADATRLAYAYLNQDWLRHIDMIEALRLGYVDVISAADDGVLLRSDTRNAVWISSTGDAAATRLASMVGMVGMVGMAGVPDMVVAHDPYSRRVAEQMLGVQTSEFCHQCALRPGDEIAPPGLSGFEFRTLGLDDAEFVANHYSLDLGLEYITDRIQAGVMIGAYPDDAPQSMAGFIGMHQQGAMGLLEVLPAYRRRRLGESLTWHLIVQQLRNGNIPFGQIVEGNEASKAMSTRLGFTISEPCVAFMHPAPVD